VAGASVLGAPMTLRSGSRVWPSWPTVATKTLTGPDRSALVVVRPDGSVLERVGRFGNHDGQFAIAHDVAVSADGAVYVGDIIGRRIQKCVREAR
jgi:hypothetical protein